MKVGQIPLIEELKHMANSDQKRIYYSSKQAIAKLVNKIIRHMRENPETIKFVKIPNIKKNKRNIQYRGYYWPDNETIDIDYRYEIIPTLIHEYLHHFHEKWAEEKVEKEERCIMVMISKKQAIKLLKVIAEVLP